MDQRGGCALSDRECEIVALAFGLLEQRLRERPEHGIAWTPPLLRDEVASLRRWLTSEPHPPTLRLVSGDAPPA